jgi:hypothetical protein
MRRIVVTAIAALMAAVATSSASAGLNPGGLTPFTETVDVNVVFVGTFGGGDPSWSDVSTGLPTTGSPKTRSKLFYELEDEADLGITFSYTYSPTYTSTAWEDQFFGYLGSIAQAKQRTLFQNEYNAQNGALDVGQNHWIDAPSVEKWIIEHPPAGVDLSKPTILFVNWKDRPDFEFHVYTKTNEPDPDTNYNFGVLRESRKIVAWGGTAPGDEENVASGSAYGGTPKRLWFYDLSAGPESWGGSFDVTNADIDGDGERDYRIPNIWEYSGSPLAANRPGYGSAPLTTDLNKVIRYVGLDLLFTTSPLYPPYFTANRLPGHVNFDVNTVEGWNQVDGSAQFIKPELFLQEEKELPSGFESTLTADYEDIKFDGDWNRCYKQFVSDKVCYNDLHPGYAAFGGFVNIFLVSSRHHEELLDGTPAYEAGLVNWSIGQKPKSPGLLGFADDNWLDGTQSGVFSFVYPDAVAAGYGLTTTMIHEYGHHSSLSHPHDGYDPESEADFGPGGDTFFAWLGDESNSMMSYIDLNWDFSQFDRDNSARHHAAGYAKIANIVADDLVGNPAAAGKLAEADTALTTAQTAFATHNYTTALQFARQGYEKVVEGAALAGVPVEIVEPSTWTIVGPVKPGNGPGKTKRAAYAKDLEEKANVKRMFGK